MESLNTVLILFVVNRYQTDILDNYIELLPLPAVILDEDGIRLSCNKLYNIFIGENAPLDFKTLLNTSEEEIFSAWLDWEHSSREPIVSQKIQLSDGNYLIHAEFVLEKYSIVIFPEYVQNKTRHIPASSDMRTNIHLEYPFLTLIAGSLPVSINKIKADSGDSETTLLFICHANDDAFFASEYWQNICAIIKNNSQFGSFDFWKSISETLIYQSYSTTRMYALLQFDPASGNTQYFGQYMTCIRNCHHTDAGNSFVLHPGDSLILELGAQLTEPLINGNSPDHSPYPPHLFDMLDLKSASFLRSWEQISYLELIPMSAPSTESFMKFLKVPAVFDTVQPFVHEIEEFFSESGFDAYAPELIATEFLVNIIKHGLNQNSDENIYVLAFRSKGKNLLIFLDKGIAWTLPPESEKLTELEFETIISDIPEGGRGMNIIYHLTSECSRRRILDINRTVFHIK